MKFEQSKYFKHRNCLDAFIGIQSVVTDTGDKTILWAYWMIQGVNGHWFASDTTRLFIQSDEYQNWLPYNPKGSTLF